MRRDHESIISSVSSAGRATSYEERTGLARRAGPRVWPRGRRHGAAETFAVLGMAVASLAACGVDAEGWGEAEADGAAAGAESAARPVRPANDAGSAAVLVSNPDPSNVEMDSAPPANVTYGDAERVFRTGDYAEAADLFEAYTLRKPANPWGHYMLGISAWRAGDLGRAGAALRRTLEMDPEHGKSLINLARVLLEDGQALEAIEYVERVVELDPKSGEGWRVLGNAHSELGTVQGALEAYRKALVLDPRDAWTMNNLGLLLIRQGRFAEALAPLARASELRPDMAIFRNNLGITLEKNGHLTEAVEAFRAALGEEPEYEKARVSLQRVEARVATVPSVPLDLAEVAAGFADEVSQWQLRSAEAAGPTASEPVEAADTMGVSRPGH